MGGTYFSGGERIMEESQHAGKSMKVNKFLCALPVSIVDIPLLQIQQRKKKKKKEIIFEINLLGILRFFFKTIS